MNGSQRWISFGFFTVQSSEIAKFSIVVYIAGYLVRHDQELKSSWKGFVRPLAIVGAVTTLLVLEPDFGAGVVITLSIMGMLFLANVPFGRYLGVISLFLVLAALAAYMQPYRVERISTFTNPWDYQFTSGYQLTQALIAFGRGEWFGLGIGNSIQKLSFLPEAHTDFVFSVIAEELGAVGAISLVLAFTGLIARCFWISRREHVRGHSFEAYLGYGLTLSLAVQTVINLGVNVGLLPTKGITLPFISFGGNSLLISAAMIAVLLRIDYEYRAELDEGRVT